MDLYHLYHHIVRTNMTDKDNEDLDSMHCSYFHTLNYVDRIDTNCDQNQKNIDEEKNVINIYGLDYEKKNSESKEDNFYSTGIYTKDVSFPLAFDGSEHLFVITFDVETNTFEYCFHMKNIHFRHL